MIQTADAPQNPETAQETTQPQAVAATLYLPRQKGERRVTVHGRAAKYEFRYCPKRKKVLRDYSSLAQFQREEVDIRENTRNLVIVCTLLGNVDPVTNAKESLEGLIAAGLKVAKEHRINALKDLSMRARAEVEVLEKPEEEAPEGSLTELTPEQKEAQTQRAEINESVRDPYPVLASESEAIEGLITSEAGVVVSGWTVTNEDGETVPAEVTQTVTHSEKVTQTEAELMSMPFDNLKLLAVKFGVAMKPPSRAHIVRELGRFR